jgi:hypothetical protein
MNCIPTGFCALNRLPKATPIYLRIQGVQEQAIQPLNCCSTLFISHEVTTVISVYTILDTALAYTDCYSFFIYSFVLFYLLHYSFTFNSDFWYITLYPRSFLIQSLILLFCFQCNSYFSFMTILHHCLLGAASPFLLFLWTDAYLMMADVDNQNM